MKYIGIFIFSLLIIAGCKNDENQTDIDEAIILDYLEKHPEIEAKKHSSGLYYQIIEPGSGGHPAIQSIVKATYKGYFTDGEVFDERTASFSLYHVIQGWQIGIPLLQKGGSGIFLIPSDLGYGGDGKGSVPGNTVLIFNVELIDF